MKRKELILEEFGKIREERLNHSLRIIENQCIDNQEKLAGKITNTFCDLLIKTKKLQEIGQKESIKYLMISHFYSSVVSNHFEIRMDLYDHRFYADPVEATTYINLEEIYGQFKPDIQYFRERLVRHIVRLKEYELQAVRYGYIELYNTIVFHLFKEIMPSLLDLPQWDEIQKTSDIKILFGEYMGKCVLLTQGETHEIFFD